ncbi:MAG: putative DNA binding domain-containing protein [Acidobacteria bacterium]|jgi:predicted HTH transcriptional regulator|nr:putative DNA binding domain-containing protein [Acidobacteriota bacterium]
MEAFELTEIIAKGESSKVQFKEKVMDAYKISAEMVAFSNSKGGMIIIGVDDKTGDVKGLSYKEIQDTNSLLVNAASENVKSPITITTETINVNGRMALVVFIEEGINKPYKDNKGLVWIKNGPDKRKVTSNEELARLLQSSGHLYADETIIPSSSLHDLDIEAFKKCLYKKYHEKLSTENFTLDRLLKLSIEEILSILELNLSLSQVLKNMRLAANDSLTLCGLLLFGNDPQKFKPVFNIQCASFVGNDISGTEFRDKENINGNFISIFKNASGFLNRNLKKIQEGKEFNTPGVLEIHPVALQELLVNALVHRDYFISSSIKLFIFDNRIEIISPGKLPNTLSIENIKSGISVARNPIIHSTAQYILPYSGLGSGILRALNYYKDIDFVNDVKGDRFISIIGRTTKE